MLMPELTDHQYLALGKFAYQFCNLERWVNWGVIEAEDIADSSKRNSVPDSPFARRLNRLEASLHRCEKLGYITLGRNFTPDLDFGRTRELGNLRNSLLHGEPHTLIDFSGDAKDPIHVNLDASHNRHVTLNVATLESMAEEAMKLAERLMDIVTNLALAKQSRGQKPRTMRTSS